MKDHEEQLRVNLDGHLKSQMKKDDRSMKEVITTLVEREYATEESEIRTKIEELQDQVEFRQRKIDRLQEQQQEDRKEISDLKSQLDDIEEQKQDYTEWLDELLDWGEKDGTRLVTDVIKARDGFHDHQKRAEEVQQDLKDRAIEQKRDLTAGDFTSTGPGIREEPLYKQAEDGDVDSEDADPDDSGYSLNYDSGTADD